MNAIFRYSLILFICLQLEQINAQRYLEEVFPQVSVTENVLYGVNATVINATTSGTADPQNLFLDIYQPSGDSDNSRPLIIYLHSGNFLPFPQNQTPSGTRSDFQVVDLCTRLAKRGYVVASCDYRLGWLPASSDQEIRNNTLINAIYRGMQDARTAARFFRKLAAESDNPYRIDSNRIIVAGEGAGAMIALTAAAVDGADDFNLPKFIQNGTPIINEIINGNADATSVGINPLNLDTLCYVNHVGYNSDFNAAFNLSGAIPEISWITSIDPAIFSIHSPTDPFFPYLTDTMNVSVLNYPLFEVSGSGAIQEAINNLGYDVNFLILNEGCDDVSTVASDNNNGVTGLYPLERPTENQNDAFPWEWWSAANVNNPNGLVVNPDMSAAKSALFQDTILAFLSPRLMCALNLEGNPCDAGLYGCMDMTACNYCDAAVNDNNSCHYIGEACDDGDSSTSDESWSTDCTCTSPIAGCTNLAACNYNSLASVEDGNCAFAGDACDDNSALTSSDTYDIDCNCVGIPINPTGCNPADINWATQSYFVSPNPNAGETLADGITGIYYSDNIYLQVPTNAQQIIPTAPNINITSITINNILVTPSGSTTAIALSNIGLSYQCNSNGTVGSCVFLPNQPSCIEIFGVPTTTGLFTLTFNINASAGFINVPYQLQVMTITIGGPGCIDATACNYNANATIDNGSCIFQGEACNDGLNYTVNDLINTDCNCEGTCATISSQVNYMPINCNGDNTEVNFTYNGGNIPDAVVINGADTLGGTITRSAGVFSYYLLTEGGCISSTNIVEIAEPSALTVILSAENVQCNGYSTGSASAIANGGTQPYAYQWNNGANTSFINETPAGEYSIVVTDNNNCIVSGNITISEPTSSLGINIFTIQPTCGNSNGSINVQTSSSVGQTLFTWDGLNGTNQLDNIGAGVYTLLVEDDFCTIDTTIIINPSNGPELNNFQIQNVSCNGGNDGSISLEIIGGTTSVTAQWSDSVEGAIRTNLTAGNYVVTLTDVLNCSYIQEFQLTEPLEIIVQTTIENIQCFGDNNGSVLFTIAGGVQPYSIQWNEVATSSQLYYNDLSPGAYDYYIEDSQNCNLSGQINILGPDSLLQVLIEGDPIVCGDLLGSATAIVSGSEQVNYQWSNGATSQAITDITVGAYFVIVTSGACSDTAYFFLGNNLPVIQDSVRNVTCNGYNNGYATATVSGGTIPYTYNWSAYPGTIPIANPNATEQNSLPPGDYYVSVTEADGCANGFSFSITEPQPIEINAVSISEISCNGYNNGSISIDIDGGTGTYNTLWSNGSSDNTIENLTAGSYSITASDENGCTTMNDFNLNEPDALSNMVTINDVNCFGNNDGSVTVAIDGGTSPYTISWNNGNPSSDFTLVNLNASELVFSVTDAQGCSSNGTATIGGPISPLMVNISGNSIVCGEDLGFISTTVTGNEGTISYQWSKEGVGVLNDTTPNIANATVGLYTIVVFSEGCTASDQYFLGNNLPLLNVQSGNVTCFDGDDGYASATPSGGEPPYTYQWYSLNGSPSITNPTDSLQNNLAAGTYTLTVSEASGCISSNEFTITQPSLLQILSNVENADCNNNFEGHIEISITGGVAPYNILWEDGSTSYTLSNLLVDDYALFISDYNGCSLQESITVAQSGEPLEVNFTTVAPTCGNANGAILSEIASSNNVVSYTWNGTVGDSNYINLTAGTYTVEYTDSLCNGSTTITLASPGGPQIDSSMVIPVSCYGGNDGEIQLYWTASSSVTFLWSNLSTSQDLISAVAGSYSVLLTDENQCTYSASYIIPEPEFMTVSFISQNNICHGDNSGNINFNITGGTSPYNLIWNGINYDENFSIADLTAGNYTYQISDIQGCINEGIIQINQPEPLQLNFVTENISCINSFGSIFTTASGGNEPYNYNWSNGDSLQFITNLSAGNYVLEIQDIYGCTLEDTVSINNNSASLSATEIATNPLCPNAFNGSILITEVLGGTAPYTYTWLNNIGQGNYAGNLSAGNYSYTITDSVGCEYNTTVTLTDPAPISGVINGPEIVNTGDTVIYTYSLTGGNYSWNSLTSSIIGANNESEFIVTWTDSINDIIQITYTDNNGCETSATLNVSVLPLSVIESIGSSVKLFPNPVNSEFTVRAPTALKNSTWRITDQTGRICLDGVMTHLFMVNVDQLCPGIYFFSTESTMKKFQVIR